jgi:hypothetical protein
VQETDMVDEQMIELSQYLPFKEGGEWNPRLFSFFSGYATIPVASYLLKRCVR